MTGPPTERQSRTEGGIVFLVPDWPWPATTGSRVRAASVATGLERLLPVTLLAGDHTDERFEQWSRAVERGMRKSPLPRNLADYATGLATGRGLILQRAVRAGLPVALEKILLEVRPSIVVLNPPYYGPFVDVVRRHGARLILGAEESLVRANLSVSRSRGLSPVRRLRSLLEAAAYGRMEKRDYPRADQLWLSSKLERRHVSGHSGAAELHVVPNVTPVVPGDVPCGGDIRAVAFVGSFGHLPNQVAAMELLRETMPAIRLAGGPRRLVLVGRDPSPAMLAAAANDPDVVVTGTVEDVAPWLCDAGVLVAPLRAGAGTRIKILEAAALGVPVVSTRFGAEGLGFEHGREILYAETPSEFASEVVRLTKSLELRTSIARSAQRAVRARFSQAAVDAAVASALGN